MGASAKPRKSKTTTRRVSVPKRRAKLHVVSPASAEEIQRSLGITKQDMAVAHASLRALGYID